MQTLEQERRLFNVWRGSTLRMSLRKPLTYGGVLLVLAGAVAALGVGAASGQNRAGQADLRIALILPDFTKNSAILGVKQGADDAAKKLGVTLITTGSGSADGQVKAVENAIAAKVDAILYDSISGGAFTNAVKEANKAGIPVVCYVSCAPGGKHASKIDFDFKAIGVPQGQWAGKMLLAAQKKDGGTPVLAIVDTDKTDLAVADIYKGFYEGLKASGVKYKQVMSPPTSWDPLQGPQVRERPARVESEDRCALLQRRHHRTRVLPGDEGGRPDRHPVRRRQRRLLEPQAAPGRQAVLRRDPVPEGGRHARRSRRP